MGKVCKVCAVLKDLCDFSKGPSNKDGYVTTCKSCISKRNKEYWRTPLGRLSQIYTAQVQVSKARKHPQPAYSKNELEDWAYLNGYSQLHAAWVLSNYQKDLCPSVDRLDPTIGYSLTNIRIVTWKDNNDKAYSDRKHCLHITKQNRKVRQCSLDGKEIAVFGSIANAARSTGITRININDVCRGKSHCKTAGGYVWQYAD